MTPIDLAFLLRRQYQTIEGEPVPVVVSQNQVLVLEARPEDRPHIEAQGARVLP